MSGDVGAEVAAVAEFLHERFAPEWVDHWRDLDDGQQRETPAWDMATALAPLIAERVKAAKAEALQRIETVLDATEWNDWPGRHRLEARLRAAALDPKEES